MEDYKLVWCKDGYRKCSCCSETFPNNRDYFYKLKTGRDGLTAQCKVCIKSKMKAKYEVEKDVILARNLAYRNANREQYNERVYEKRRANPEHYAEIKSKSWYKHRELNIIKSKEKWNINKDKYLDKIKLRISIKKGDYNLARKEKRDSNISAFRQREKEWRDKNPEKIKMYLKNAWARATPQKRLRTAFGASICHSLQSRNKGGRGWQDILGYTKEDLVAHLEKQFKEGMSWDNYGFYGWHVDHVIPQAMFTYETVDDEDFHKCWALNNLQPLWAEENHSKGARWIG